MKTKERIISVALLLSLIFIGWGCKSSNDAKQALQESEIVQAVAQFLGYNLNKDSKLEGISKGSLVGSQVLDANYDGYERCQNCFLENGNKTLSFYITRSDPDPDREYSDSFNGAFADDTFPFKIALTGTVKPLEVTAKTVASYQGSGTASTAWTNKWTVAYDSTTGYPTTNTSTWIDPATGSTGDSGTGNTVTTVYTFGTDTMDTLNNYYNTLKTYKEYSGATLALQSQLYEGVFDLAGLNINSTQTEECKTPSGALSTSYCGLEGSEDVLNTVSNAARIIETNVLSGDTWTKTKKFYDASGDEMNGRMVIESEYADLNNFRLAAEARSQYDISSDASTTLNRRYVRGYTNGFRTTEARYGQSSVLGSGVLAVLDNTSDFTRDTQGQFIDLLRKDASGDATNYLVYAYDSNSRISTRRMFEYTSGVRDTTPSCTWGGDYVRDYSRSRDTSGNTTFTIIVYCNGVTYVSTGYAQVVSVYNSTGLLTSYSEYLFNASTPELTSKETYEYNSDGNRTKKQYYSVTAGVATATGYETYAYDAHKFWVTTKKYDADGDLATDATNTTSKCSALAAGTECYTTTTYTYK